jgi:hypothetical protein
MYERSSMGSGAGMSTIGASSEGVFLSASGGGGGGTERSRQPADPITISIAKRVEQKRMRLFYRFHRKMLAGAVIVPGNVQQQIIASARWRTMKSNPPHPVRRIFHCR